MMAQPDFPAPASSLPALRLRAVRSGLTICHWQIVRAALTPLPTRLAHSGNGPADLPLEGPLFGPGDGKAAAYETQSAGSPKNAKLLALKRPSAPKCSTSKWKKPTM
jgi:hypothetical protein